MPRSNQHSPCLMKPHFIKIFIPELTGTCLTIPPAFLKNMENDKSCRKASLTGPSGNVWNVDLVKDTDGMVAMQAGWLTFVADNSITPYDFLLFRYEGNLRFTVMIFDKSSCEKEDAVLATTSLKFDAPPPYRNEGQFPVTPDVPHDACLHENTSTAGCCSVSQQSFPQVKEEAVELPLPSSDHYRSYGGIVKECLAAHKLRSRFSKFTPPDVRSGGSTSSHSLNIRHSQVTGQVRMLSLASNRRPVTEDEVSKAYEAATLFKSDHPTALVVMRESYVYSGFYMNFPNSFVRDHLPKQFANMKLWNPNRSLWFVKYVYYNGRGGLSANWGEFSQSNNLELDDVCVFELIHENEMQVHIFRVVQELTPLSSGGKKSPSLAKGNFYFKNHYLKKKKKKLANRESIVSFHSREDSYSHGRRLLRQSSWKNDSQSHKSHLTDDPTPPQKNTLDKVPLQSTSLEKPNFTITLKPYNLSKIGYLRIPFGFEAFDFMMDKDTTVLTDVVIGKSWTVSVRQYYLSNRRPTIRFHGGWLNFCQDKNLEVGDVCKFELLSEGDIPEMAVEVHRKQEEDPK